MESIYVKREQTIPLEPHMRLDHDFTLVMKKDTSHGRIYQCFVDPESNTENRLFQQSDSFTALEFATAHEVMAYNEKARSRPYDFKGFLVFSFGGSVYVLGEYVGVSVKEWIDAHQSHLWDRTNLKSQRARLVGSLGKQLAYILTDRHEDGQYLGNLKNAIRVKGFRESPVVTVASLDENNLAIEEGIRKDLQKFREIIEMCEIPQFHEGNKPHDLQMFYKLYPKDQGSFNDLQSLKDLSYRICHAPIFWDFKERYRFAQLFWELGKEFTFFRQVVRMDSDPTNVGNWVGKVAKDRNNVLYKVLKKGAPGDLISFHRVVMEHCTELEVGTTAMLDADTDLRNLFPEAYPMAYLELFENFHAHCPDLINRMKSRSLGLYYGKKVNMTD